MSSRGINKVIIIGNLGSDPEVRYGGSNNRPWTKLSVATSESWRDKATGEQREKTEWHNVILGGRLAEIAGEHLRKGSQVYIEGRLQTRKWEDQSGQNRYTSEVIVQGFNGVMRMLDSRPNNPHQGGWGQPQQPAPQPSPQQYNEPPMDFDDDIPFRDTFARGARTAYACS